MIRSAMCLVLLLATGTALAERAVDIHGDISVVNGQVVDSHGAPLSLAGPSLFWGNRGWGAGSRFSPDQYYNHGVVSWFRNHWNAPIIRIAMGAETRGGILDDTEGRWQKIADVAEAAIDEGMYFIVDWHSHRAEDNTEAAAAFMQRVARQWGHTPNLIYEIYNEPLITTDWSTVVRPYAESVIAAIRQIDPDNLIVVGTQSWSQDVDKAADDPITGWPNIAYALHFYAGSHRQALRDKAKYAIDSDLPLIVTEWGTVNADGDGAVDEVSTLEWMAFLREQRLTHLNWSVNSKDESASMLRPGTAPNGQWNTDDLTESGLLVGEIIRNWHVHDYTCAER